MITARLEEQIVALAGNLHASTARFIDAAVALDESAEWSGIGMRSCAHWLTIATGVDLWNAREMLRVGHAVRELPRIHEAFAAGRLSFDKVRALSHVATAADQDIWLDVALEASGAQLTRICLQFRRSIAVDDPRRAAMQRARRRVVSWWLDEDGMLALFAVLPPEEGQLVLHAIESAVVRAVGTLPATDASASPEDGVGASASPAGDLEDPCAEDPCGEVEPDHPHGARRADALVHICERWLDATTTTDSTGTVRAELVVHVDVDTLTGADEGGRCHLEGGPAISVAAARRWGCDAQLVAVLERDGVPVDAGRSQRVVSGRLRRLLQLRDQGCRYPGCAVPAADTEGHHVVHWVEGGRTILANLISLCRFHHHRHHEGAFRIVAGTEAAARAGRFWFEVADGRRIGVRPTGAGASSAHGPAKVPAINWLRDAAAITPEAPAARGGGGGFDLDHAIVVLAGNRANALRRAAEQPSGP